MNNFARLIAALDKEYADRNEGLIEWDLQIGRDNDFVTISIFDGPYEADNGITRYTKTCPPLAPHEPNSVGIESCALAILKQMGVE